MMGFFNFVRPKPATPADVNLTPKSGMTGAWLGLALTMVAGFEGLYTHAYKDPVGVVTICFGVTNADRSVKMGDTATKDECYQMLEEDLPRYKAMVDRQIHVAMPPHRTAAMVSFVYNVGEGNLKKSSVARYLNAKQVQKGCDALMAWTKAGGRELPGLVKRRKAERAYCLRSD